MRVLYRSDTGAVLYAVPDSLWPEFQHSTHVALSTYVLDEIDANQTVAKALQQAPSSYSVIGGVLKLGGNPVTVVAQTTHNIVEVNLGTVAHRSGHFDITTTGLDTTKSVFIQQAPGPYTGKGTRQDEAEMDQLRVNAYVVNATTIRAYWEAQHLVRGNYKFVFEVHA